MKYTKNQSILIIAIIYAGALMVTYLLMQFLNTSLLLKTLLGDIFCTSIIFIFSRKFKNSSVYDQYWSVIPFFLALFWIQNSTSHSTTIYWLLAGLLLWGTRLTFNWISGWKGLHVQDWRYTELQDKTGKYYWWVSFLGIHLFPTLIVFLGCLPTYFLITKPTPATPWQYISFIVILIAIIIEMIADIQMRNHRKKNTGKLIKTGIWLYSRHPNYLGEILFWIGLFLLSFASAPYWTIVGPAGMIFLFYFISIPMMEKRLEKREGYLEYHREVSRLLPWNRSRN